MATGEPCSTCGYSNAVLVKCECGALLCPLCQKVHECEHWTQPIPTLVSVTVRGTLTVDRPND